MASNVLTKIPSIRWTVWNMSEAATGGVLRKKVFLKIS